jgi:hypothetical protein
LKTSKCHRSRGEGKTAHKDCGKALRIQAGRSEDKEIIEIQDGGRRLTRKKLSVFLPRPFIKGAVTKKYAKKTSDEI